MRQEVSNMRPEVGGILKFCGLLGKLVNWRKGRDGERDSMHMFEISSFMVRPKVFMRFDCADIVCRLYLDLLLSCTMHVSLFFCSLSDTRPFKSSSYVILGRGRGSGTIRVEGKGVFYV